MSRHFLQLWRPAQVEYELKGNPILNHSGSEQLYRVHPDDFIWIVTVYPHGKLYLIGKLQVGERTDFTGAKKSLGTEDVYDATYHVIAKRGTEQRLRKINIMDIAADLRFESERDRLKLVGGRVNAQQLQTIRELNPASITLLNAKWSGS